MEITPEIASQQHFAMAIMAAVVIPIILIALMRGAMVNQPMRVTVAAAVGLFVFVMVGAWLAPLGGSDIWQQALKP